MLSAFPMARAADDPAVSLSSLLAEMTDPCSPARWPTPMYESLQASSYNRASVHRDKPHWFADSDGTGFIRTEGAEWVIMEHHGPGCITKMWTPFFYHDFNERKGPDVRIYLDGATTPVIAEPFIGLLTGQSFLKPPFGGPTARAGNAYLPIPFAKSCKITLTGKPFYNIINYRAFPPGTAVTTFRKEQLAGLAPAGKKLVEAAVNPPQRTATESLVLAPGESRTLVLPPGPAAIAWFSIHGDKPQTRSIVLGVECDGEQTIWCPLGDFFCCADSIHPFHTWQRTVSEDGTMTCRWPMPYRKSATITLANHGRHATRLEWRHAMIPWQWDDRSMHFHANWRADDLLPGTPIVDWNFIDIRGQGVYVGDAWTVLNPTQGWWGEGDEKIYVDGSWDKGFPTHFGTGTEDYYGWAGGVNPTRADEFSSPFLANVRVGGVDGNHTRGYNISTRTRSLDAIPFHTRLCFDMEASPGVDQRRKSDYLGYSAVTFWYARPGATHNRPPAPESAARPIMSLPEIEGRAAKITSPDNGIEFELLKPSAMTPGLRAGPQRPAEAFKPDQWSGEAHYFIAANTPGDFVEFSLTEQFQAQSLVLRATTSYDFGVARILVNGRVVAGSVDLFSAVPAVREINLGRHAPLANQIIIRCELAGPNPRSRGARTFMGLDNIVLMPPNTEKRSLPVVD